MECAMPLEGGGPPKKANEDTKRAAKALDKAAGLGDKEEENDSKWLEEQLRRQLKEQADFEAAMERIKEANEQGYSVFETLIGIANANGIDATDFLTSCGFKSPEELKKDKNAEEALANYMVARGNFEDNRYTFDSAGNTVFADSNQAINSANTFGTSAAMWAYMNDFNMVEMGGNPFFIHSSDGVTEMDGLSYAMIEKMHLSGEITDDEYNAMLVSYGAVNNTNLYIEGNVIPVSSIMKKTTIDNFPIEDLDEEEQDENGVLLCEYLMFNENYDLANKINATREDSGFKSGEDKEAAFDDIALLYYAWMCAHGYTIQGDKTNNEAGLSIYKPSGEKLDHDKNGGLFDFKFSGDIIETLCFIDNEIQKRRPEYAGLDDEQKLTDTFESVFEDDILTSLGELLNVEAEHRTVLEELLLPIATVGQAASAFCFGSLNFVEHFVDGLGSVLIDIESGLVIVGGTLYSFSSGIGSLITNGDFSAGWLDGMDETMDVAGDLQDLKKAAVAYQWSQALQVELYKSGFGKWLDEHASFNHDSETYALIQEQSELFMKNVAYRFLESCGIPEPVANAIYSLGESNERNYNQIKDIIDAYNRKSGTEFKLDWKDYVDLNTELNGYIDAGLGAIDKMTDAFIGNEMGEKMSEITDKFTEAYDFGQAGLGDLFKYNMQTAGVGLEEYLLRVVSKAGVSEVGELIDTYGLSENRFPPEVIEWAKENDYDLTAEYDGLDWNQIIGYASDVAYDQFLTHENSGVQGDNIKGIGSDKISDVLRWIGVDVDTDLTGLGNN